MNGLINIKRGTNNLGQSATDQLSSVIGSSGGGNVDEQQVQTLIDNSLIAYDLSTTVDGKINSALVPYRTQTDSNTYIQNTVDVAIQNAQSTCRVLRYNTLELGQPTVGVKIPFVVYQETVKSPPFNSDLVNAISFSEQQAYDIVVTLNIQFTEQTNLGQQIIITPDWTPDAFQYQNDNNNLNNIYLNQSKKWLINVPNTQSPNPTQNYNLILTANANVDDLIINVFVQTQAINGSLLTGSELISLPIQISDVNGLQLSLDAKLESPIDQTDVSGLVSSLTGKYDTGQQLNLTGLNYITYSAVFPTDYLQFTQRSLMTRAAVESAISALAGGGINLPIEISDVNGLQLSLDSKFVAGTPLAMNNTAITDIASAIFNAASATDYQLYGTNDILPKKAIEDLVLALGGGGGNYNPPVPQSDVLDLVTDLASRWTKTEDINLVSLYSLTNATQLSLYSGSATDYTQYAVDDTMPRKAIENAISVLGGGGGVPNQTVTIEIAGPMASHTRYVINHGLNSALQDLQVTVTYELINAQANIPLAVGDKISPEHQAYIGNTGNASNGVTMYQDANQIADFNQAFILKTHDDVITVSGLDSNTGASWDPLVWPNVKALVTVTKINTTSTIAYDTTNFTQQQFIVDSDHRTFGEFGLNAVAGFNQTNKISLNDREIYGGPYPLTNDVIDVVLSNDNPSIITGGADVRYLTNTSKKVMMYHPQIRVTQDRLYVQPQNSYQFVAQMLGRSGGHQGVQTRLRSRLNSDGEMPLFVINPQQPTSFDGGLQLPSTFQSIQPSYVFNNSGVFAVCSGTINNKSVSSEPYNNNPWYGPETGINDTRLFFIQPAGITNFTAGQNPDYEGYNASKVSFGGSLWWPIDLQPSNYTTYFKTKIQAFEFAQFENDLTVIGTVTCSNLVETNPSHRHLKNVVLLESQYDDLFAKPFPNTYKWKYKSEVREKFGYDNREHIGLTIEDLQDFDPQNKFGCVLGENKNGHKSIDETRLLKLQCAWLVSRVNKMDAMMTKLIETNNKLSRIVGRLQESTEIESLNSSRSLNKTFDSGIAPPRKINVSKVIPKIDLKMTSKKQ